MSADLKLIRRIKKEIIFFQEDNEYDKEIPVGTGCFADPQHRSHRAIFFCARCIIVRHLGGYQEKCFCRALKKNQMMIVFSTGTHFVLMPYRTVPYRTGNDHCVAVLLF